MRNNVETTAGKLNVQIEGNTDDFALSLTTESVEEGLYEITLRMTAQKPKQPPSLSFEWSHPAVGVQGVWDTDYGKRNNFIGSSFTSKSTSQAPVVCLFNMRGDNSLTFAYSDVLNPHQIVAWIDEYTAAYLCSIKLFVEPGAPIDSYEAKLRLDTRPYSYVQCLKEVTEWWENMPGYKPAYVPEAARLPVYSTWYSFHQQLTDTAVEQQCERAKELGCDLLIMDDGWQTSEVRSAYASCGDWNAAPEHIPDMKAHVSRIQQMGIQYMLWYSVPFVGKDAKAWKRFEGKWLDYNEGFQAGVLDPRFPEVRAYLIGIYESAVRDWNLDGLKLDFVDYFNLGKSVPNEFGGGRDYASIPIAVDRLMCDVIASLRAIKPDILIEFRQTYVGPLMRTYGNILRVSDCPNDLIMNRVGSIDLRLLSGKTAVHSDMIMWHPEESAEGAALQLIHSMFAVPQISVLLDQIPEEHLQMLRHWLAFWKANRDVLLDGELMPIRPDLLYPMVVAKTKLKWLAAVYADTFVQIPKQASREIIVINGTLSHRIVIECLEDLGLRSLEIYDCCGTLRLQEQRFIQHGFHAFEVPPAGMMKLLG